MASLHRGLGLQRECVRQQRTAWPRILISRSHPLPSEGTRSRMVVSRASREQQLLEELLEQMRKTNSKLGKLSKQVQRLETRVCEMYEFTSLPLISGHFGNDFAESVDLRSASHIVDHILNLALNLDLPALKQRGALINILEEYVMKDRQGLRAAMKALMDEACEDCGVCMIALPSTFQTADWDDIRACLQELQLGFSSHGTGPSLSSHFGGQGGLGAPEDRIANLMRYVDAMAATGQAPKPLPGFMEMATALAGGGRGCGSRVALDCRGRIDVRDTFIEFHFGAFKGVNSGLPETCQQLRRAAALFVWAYKVLEPHLHSHSSGSTAAAAAAAAARGQAQQPQPRDVAAIGYAFNVGKAPPQDSLLKLYDDFVVEVGGRKSESDIAYRYFSVRPTGLHEHYAKV